MCDPVCKDGLIDARSDGQMDGRIYRWIAEWLNELTHARMHGMYVYAGTGRQAGGRAGRGASERANE